MKQMRKVFVTVLCVAMVSLMMLAGCGSSGGNSNAADDPYAGTWVATKAEAYGLEMGISEVWESGFSIELKGNGKLTADVDGTTGDGTYEITDDQITITIEGEELTGIMKENEFLIEDAFGYGVSVLFAKDGTDAIDNGAISDFYDTLDLDEATEELSAEAEAMDEEASSELDLSGETNEVVIAADETVAPSGECAYTTQELKDIWDACPDVYKMSYSDIVDQAFGGTAPTECHEHSDDTAAAAWISSEDSSVYITIFLVVDEETGEVVGNSRSASNIQD